VLLNNVHCVGSTQAPGRYKAFVQALLMLRSQRDSAQESRTAEAERTQMSELFRFPHSFVRHDSFEAGNRPLTVNALSKLGNVACSNNNRSAALRDDHIILAVIDGLFYLHASCRQWRNHRQTLRALADLDDAQLRDIGLTRDDPIFDSSFRCSSYRATTGDTK